MVLNNDKLMQLSTSFTVKRLKATFILIMVIVWITQYWTMLNGWVDRHGLNGRPDVVCVCVCVCVGGVFTFWVAGLRAWTDSSWRRAGWRSPAASTPGSQEQRGGTVEQEKRILYWGKASCCRAVLRERLIDLDWIVAFNSPIGEEQVSGPPG